MRLAIMMSAALLLWAHLAGCPATGTVPSSSSDDVILPEGQKARWENLGTRRIEVTEGWATVFRAEALLHTDAQLSSENRRLALDAVSREVSAESLGILVAVEDPDFLARTISACNSQLEGLQILGVRFPEMALEESVPIRQ